MRHTASTGLPVSTCPSTDRHGYHMWADADRTAICPGHPAPPPVDVAAAMTGVTPGGNAEDCPRCAGTNPPYPFLCPGHPSPDAARTTPDNPPTSSGRADNSLTGQVCAYADELYAAPQRIDACEVRERLLAMVAAPAVTVTFAEAKRDWRADAPTELGTPAANANETTRHVGASSVGEPATADDGRRQRVAAAILDAAILDERAVGEDGVTCALCAGVADSLNLADAVLAALDTQEPTP